MGGAKAICLFGLAFLFFGFLIHCTTPRKLSCTEDTSQEIVILNGRKVYVGARSINLHWRQDSEEADKGHYHGEQSPACFPGFYLQDVDELTELRQLKDLRSLEIIGSSPPIDTEFLDYMPGLESINFHCAKLKSLDLSRHTNLRYLIISYTGVRDLGSVPNSLRLLVVSSDMPREAIEDYKKRNPKVNIVPAAKDDCDDSKIFGR